MNESKHLAILMVQNLALTAIVLVVWLIIGFLVGTASAGERHPDAANYLSHGGSVQTKSLDEYYATRDGAMTFCGWCGLISAQVVFIVHQFLGRQGASTAPGGFPVKEL